MMKVVCTACALFSLTISTAVFAKPVKVPVCHYSEEDQIWVMINLPEKAAQNHMNRHDDAVPGGVTAITGTQLNENCETGVPPEDGSDA